jgi:hypothetical protein
MISALCDHSFRFSVPVPAGICRLQFGRLRITSNIINQYGVPLSAIDKTWACTRRIAGMGHHVVTVLPPSIDRHCLADRTQEITSGESENETTVNSIEVWKNVERRDMVTVQPANGSRGLVAQTVHWSDADGSLSRSTLVSMILPSGLSSYSRARWTIVPRAPKPHARVPTMMSAAMRLERAQ